MKDERHYLEDMLEHIAHIEDFTAGGKTVFNTSSLVREAVVRCFEIIGEIVKRLSADKLDAYPDIHWQEWVEFGDFLIDSYDRVDFAIVWKRVEVDVPQLKEAIKDMLAKYNA